MMDYFRHQDLQPPASEADLALLEENLGLRLIDRHDGRPWFVSIPFVPMQRNEIRRLGATFTEFLSALSSGEGW